MTTRSFHRLIALFSISCAFFIIVPQKTHAEILYSENYGYYLDLPEAFALDQQSQDEKSLFFTHTILPVYLAVKVYDSGEYSTSEEALSDILKQLNAQKSVSSLKWNGFDSSISNFSLSMPDRTINEGWASAVAIPQKNAFIIMMCYTPSESKKQCEQFILSVLDSFIPEKSAFTKSGLVTSFAYPGSTRKTISLNINGKKISTAVDAEDAEAAKFVVDREYAVLTLYANHDLWKEAWTRYYRNIYRDSYSRLNQVSADIYKALFADAMKADAENPEKAYGKEILTWVQNFTYARDSKNADFTDLISAVNGKGSDCDSRSLLLCVLMKHIGVDSTLFISREYSHAIAGFDIASNGAKINVAGKDFLLADSTTHVEMGLIAQSLSDTSKWIPVELP